MVLFGIFGGAVGVLMAIILTILGVKKFLTSSINQSHLEEPYVIQAMEFLDFYNTSFPPKTGILFANTMFFGVIFSDDDLGIRIQTRMNSEKRGDWECADALKKGIRTFINGKYGELTAEKMEIRHVFDGLRKNDPDWPVFFIFNGCSSYKDIRAYVETIKKQYMKLYKREIEICLTVSENEIRH